MPKLFVLVLELVSTCARHSGSVAVLALSFDHRFLLVHEVFFGCTEFGNFLSLSLEPMHMVNGFLLFGKTKKHLCVLGPHNMVFRLYIDA